MDNSVPLKRCTKCGNEHPATPEYFYRDKSNIRYGLKPECKVCVKARKPDRDIARASERKYRMLNPEKVLETARRYRDSHRKEIQQRQREKYNSNPEKYRNASRESQHRHREKYKEYNKTYYENNIEKERQRSLNYQRKNRIVVREKQRLYRLSNLNKDRIKSQRRRSRKKGASGKYTLADIANQLKSQHSKCYYCGVNLDDIYTIEHVVPLSRGGSNAPDNIVISCPHCNFSKGTKLPHEWPEGGRLL